MDSLKQFMRKNVYKLVYASVSGSGIISDKPSIFLFGEIPFPTQEYMSIKNNLRVKTARK